MNNNDLTVKEILEIGGLYKYKAQNFVFEELIWNDDYSKIVSRIKKENSPATVIVIDIIDLDNGYLQTKILYGNIVGWIIIDNKDDISCFKKI